MRVDGVVRDVGRGLSHDDRFKTVRYLSLFEVDVVVVLLLVVTTRISTRIASYVITVVTVAARGRGRGGSALLREGSHQSQSCSER